MSRVSLMSCRAVPFRLRERMQRQTLHNHASIRRLKKRLFFRQETLYGGPLEL